TSANVTGCDELAAHPDDPGKPRGVAGVEFDAMSEAATREAVEVCSAAAREHPGELRARFNLGRALQRTSMLRPLERAESLRRAREAYAEAAQRDYPAAQGNYGQMLYGGGLGQRLNEGTGPAPDPREAVEWLRKSAAGNYPDAYLTLAHAYITGRGVEQADARKAYC